MTAECGASLWGPLSSAKHAGQLTANLHNILREALTLKNRRAVWRSS